VGGPEYPQPWYYPRKPISPSPLYKLAHCPTEPKSLGIGLGSSRPKEMAQADVLEWSVNFDFRRLLVFSMRVQQLKQPFFNLPFFLVLSMGACVFFTGLVSYQLGDEALEGVMQPETNPTQKLLSKSSKTSEAQATVKFTPANIAQTAKETRIYIQNQQKAKSKSDQPATDSPAPKAEKSPEAGTEKKP